MVPADPIDVVQRQLDAYNAHDLDAFVACYAKEVKVYRMPALEPALAGRAALREFYRTQRFNRPDLHATLVARLVVGRKVIDHEEIVGLDDAPRAAVALYGVDLDGLIATAWFFDPS